MARRTYDERIAELTAKKDRELAVKSAKERLTSIRALINDDNIAGAVDFAHRLVAGLELIANPPGNPPTAEVTRGK
jgi:hypothetical protein